MPQTTFTLDDNVTIWSICDNLVPTTNVTTCSSSKIYLADPYLMRLSKVTGYNYLRDGYVSFVVHASDSGDYLLMKHCFMKLMPENKYTHISTRDNILYVTISDGTSSYSSEVEVTTTKIIVDIINRFWKPHIDTRDIIGHYMKYPKMTKICDIIVTCLEN